MNHRLFLSAFSLLNISVSALSAGAFFGDPPDVNHPWAVHDRSRPQPVVVTPGATCGVAPSDAIILFDGTEQSFENWEHETPDSKRRADWIVADGVLQCQPGSRYIQTKEAFGDIQLHIEWASPADVVGSGQNRGNSGVFFMNGMVEVQILDNYQNPTYADGTVGAVYGVMPPAVNALRPRGEWQSYDIIFRRPIVRDGVVLDPGSLTVLCNGVVLQDSTQLEGGGGYKARKPMNRAFPDVGRLKLQDHGSPVRFRNIWYRPLRPRPLDGGTDGFLSPEATLAKRVETASTLREQAQSLEGVDKALVLLESLIYQLSESAQLEAETLVADYLKQLSTQSGTSIQAEKKTVQKLHGAFTYLKKYGFIPKVHGLSGEIQALAIENGWVKTKKR